MKFIPRPHIPMPVLRALQSDAYRATLHEHMGNLPAHIRGKFDHTISVTTLPRSPRQRLLFMRHEHEIVIDPELQGHAMLGRITHSILETGAEPWQVVEERLGILVPIMANGQRIVWYVHGQCDLHDTKTLEMWDYKTPRTSSLRYGATDKQAQLNILAYIWRINGRKVASLKNHYMLLKDWNARYVREEDPASEYPRSPFVTVEVPMWTDEQCADYIKDRLTKHYLNESRKDDELDHCDDQELWRSEPLYKVYKLEEDGQRQKTAKYNGASKEIAQQTMEGLAQAEKQKVIEKNNEKKKPKPEDDLVFPKYELVELPSSPRRCGFCEARFFCSQRLAQLVAEMETGLQSTEEHEEGGE